MKDKFFDFTIYRIESSPDTALPTHSQRVLRTSFVVFYNNSGGTEAKSKIQQIMSSVQLKPEMYSIESHLNDPSILDNALKSKKVTHVMIFDPESVVADGHDLNTPFQIDDTNIFVTSRIDDIILEEKTGETALRRALWTGLKKWLGS